MTRTRQAFNLTELAELIADEARAHAEVGAPSPILTIVNSDVGPAYSLVITSR